MLLQGQKTKQQDVSAWMTGIQEVQLPMDFKLKNIEETEAAKKRLLASAGAGPGRQAHPALPQPYHVHTCVSCVAASAVAVSLHRWHA